MDLEAKLINMPSYFDSFIMPHKKVTKRALHLAKARESKKKKKKKG